MRYCLQKKGSFEFCFQSFDKYECEEHAKANGLRWSNRDWRISLSEDEDGNPEDIMLLVVQDYAGDVEVITHEGEVLTDYLSPAQFAKFSSDFKLRDDDWFMCKPHVVELRPLIDELQWRLVDKIYAWTEKNGCMTQ